MRVPETTALMIAEIADLSARAIGFNRRFEVMWMRKNDKKRIERFLFGNKKMNSTEECIGLNLRTYGADAIALDPEYLMSPRRELEEIVDLVAHEICHFKVVGHGKKFQKLLKSTMKKLMK